jgi:hypothetical protein
MSVDAERERQRKRRRVEAETERQMREWDERGKPDLVPQFKLT